MRKCCDYFDKGLKEINRYILVANARDSENTYKNKPFEYCPWCGKKLDRESIK